MAFRSENRYGISTSSQYRTSNVTPFKVHTILYQLTKENNALIQTEVKAGNRNDFISVYLRSLDTELENIDKRVRLMMNNVESHSQIVRSNALANDRKVKPVKQSIASRGTSIKKLGMRM